MTANETLVIDMEEVGSRTWWRRVLAIIGSPDGGAYVRFVARDHETVRYKSATFPAPRAFGDLPPRERWAPGMTTALKDLQAEIESDGWIEVSKGAQPWMLRYERVLRPA